MLPGKMRAYIAARFDNLIRLVQESNSLANPQKAIVENYMKSEFEPILSEFDRMERDLYEISSCFQEEKEYPHDSRTGAR